MRHALRRVPSLTSLVLVAAASAVAVCTFAACGGSASESPWPVEPEGPVLGPAGESSATPVVKPRARPDAGQSVAE